MFVLFLFCTRAASIYWVVIVIAFALYYTVHFIIKLRKDLKKEHDLIDGPFSFRL